VPRCPQDDHSTCQPSRHNDAPGYNTHRHTDTLIQSHRQTHAYTQRHRHMHTEIQTIQEIRRLFTTYFLLISRFSLTSKSTSRCRILRLRDMRSSFSCTQSRQNRLNGTVTLSRLSSAVSSSYDVIFCKHSHQQTIQTPRPVRCCPLVSQFETEQTQRHRDSPRLSSTVRSL